MKIFVSLLCLDGGRWGESIRKEDQKNNAEKAKIYYVDEVVNNTFVESPFDGNTDNASSKYMTFSKYFNKK